MIKARFNCTKTNSISLSIKGHSGAADIGQDIVCASASILAYTVAQLVKDYANAGYLKSTPKVMMRKGNSTITCTPKDEHFNEVYYAFYYAQTGINLLAHNYPQYVTLKMFGEA